jgi:hypothetical protein
MVAELQSEGMVKLAIAPLMLASLALLAQESKARTEFVGTWEAKVNGQVICTIRLARGEPLSGEMDACSIQVDENGDCKRLSPQRSRASLNPSSM